MSARDLLLEIGCEELPSSFVDAALKALPELAKKRLGELRLSFGALRALGTARRLTLIVEGLAEAQPDLEEELLGPPTRAAFKDGAPTRAAEAFAEKLGVPVAELRRVDTPKGEYLAGTKRETGRPTEGLLPALLEALIREIPFRKSMRWGDLDFAFGRPIQWLVALFGDAVVPVEIATRKAGNKSLGHRFLAPGEVIIPSAAKYVEIMRAAHVLVDPAERREALRAALLRAAESANGALIEDEFLMDENLSLVEEPHVVVGGFEQSFLVLPEHVILEVARGHQRYFGLRDKVTGKLLPNYLAVVNTALAPELIRKGNDSVMRARLADAAFFFREDQKTPLAQRRAKLGGIVFQKKLGTVLAKADRVEALAGELGKALGLSAETIGVAQQGAHLAKCDLVTLMVGEFPELQGEMGAAYALGQGVAPAVAEVISEHYRPKGASDETPHAEAAALVSIADRLDTLVGCFGIGLSPTGTADPFALRRAVIGVLRTVLDRGFDLSLRETFTLAHARYADKVLEVAVADLVAKLSDFSAERLRGLLEAELAGDVVRACLGAGADRPIDVRRRAQALATLEPSVRAQLGEVFKRANNIATQAPEGEPTPPAAGSHASELALFEAYGRFRQRSDELSSGRDYAGLLREVATIAPVMHQYFLDIFVMDPDATIRDNRLRLMRSISQRCQAVARLELLAS